MDVERVLEDVFIDQGPFLGGANQNGLIDALGAEDFVIQVKTDRGSALNVTVLSLTIFLASSGIVTGGTSLPGNLPSIGTPADTKVPKIFSGRGPPG